MPTAANRIPLSLQAEHEELHVALTRLGEEAGQIGVAAREVTARLLPHFLREEQVALPPLGVLSALAEGRMTPEMPDALTLARTLKDLMPQMLEEHIAIVSALQTLTDTAREVGRDDVASVAQKLMAHAQMEEEVLYPSAIVVGELLALKLNQ